MTCRAANIALVASGKTLTYQEMVLEAHHIAERVVPRSVVLFVASNTEESLLAYVGFIRHGVVPLMVNEGMDSATCSELLNAYQPEYLWCPHDYPYRGTTAWNYGNYRLWKTGHESKTALYDDLALLLSTSGSTGSQKYVRLSYDNLTSNAEAIASYLAIKESNRAITTLPFSYSYGLSIINSHLISGASLVLTEKTLFDREFWDLVRNHEVTTFGGVPYTYSMLKRLRFERMDLPSLRYLTQAGGGLSKELQVEFAEICRAKGMDFIVMYGQTEGTARLSYLPPEYAQTKLGSVGHAIPGGRLFLLDTSGAEIHEAHTAGELLYEGENVSLGYAQGRADLARGDDNNGRLQTGDIACFDEDGFFNIVGRQKRFIKMFGNRVNLDELESLLRAEGTVAACSGADDALCVYVEKGDLAQIQTFVAEKTGLYKRAFTVQSIQEIPRNEAGKILYSELDNHA